MLFTDGECPRCISVKLHLNCQDLLECPTCNLVFSAADPLCAAVMPFLGRGRFRLEDGRVHQCEGALVCHSLGLSLLPDVRRPLADSAALGTYRHSLLAAEDGPRTRPLATTQRFIEAFHDSLMEFDALALANAWPRKTRRTKLYADSTMPDIARELGLQHRRERFTVDHALVREDANGHEVAQIYIESENEYGRATHEMQKLCSLNSPVRVLITATEKLFPPQPAQGGYGQLRIWQSLVRAHGENNQMFAGILVVIIGRRHEDALTFDACAFHSDGDLAIPFGTIFSRPLQW